MVENAAIDCGLKADIFIRTYYETMDASRHDTHHLYNPNGKSQVIWNGRKIQDLAAFFKDTLPPSLHSIVTLDCQPVRGLPGRPFNIVVNVGGTVIYSKAKTYNFHQAFILTCLVDNKFVITNDIFRFT